MQKIDLTIATSRPSIRVGVEVEGDTSYLSLPEITRGSIEYGKTLNKRQIINHLDKCMNNCESCKARLDTMIEELMLLKHSIKSKS